MKNLFTLLLLLFIFSSCVPKNSKTGVWSSLGGGWVMNIEEDGSYIEYDVTEISCLVAKENHIDEFEDRLYLKEDTLKLKRGPLEYSYVKTSNVPEICNEAITPEKAADPIYNFEVFANTIKHHFAFMEQNGIDFDSLYNAEKAKIEADPNDLSLYRAMDHMLISLKDNHGGFDASDDVYEALEAENDEEENEDFIGDFEISALVAGNHLETELTKDSFLVQWGYITNNIGYIHIKAMFLHADLGLSEELIDSMGWGGAYTYISQNMNEGAYIKKEAEGASKVMAKALTDLADTESLIIDLRFNGGGQDAVSLAMLKHFNDEERVIATERLIHEEGLSPTVNVMLESVSNPYSKPTFVLTSRQTGSAAEIFAMATKELDHVKLVGEPTMGALSTTLDKSLPNGWFFTISNEIYKALDGEVYEYRGIPADIEVNINSEDRQAYFRSVKENLADDKKWILETVKADLENQ